jgi:TetR/AcrR family transcriptional repressor of nem operon
MPRPVEFDREQVLRDAMLQFWRHGYHKTSVRDLTAATRLQPGSLYGAFTNKRTLFLKSLDYYTETLQATVDQVLRSKERPLARIRRFFNLLLDETASDPEEKGCLLVNTLLETPTEEREITQRAAGALAYVEGAFADVLEEAKRSGELPPDADAGALAKMLMTGIFGLRVYAKMQLSQGTLASIAETILSTLHCNH